MLETCWGSAFVSALMGLGTRSDERRALAGHRANCLVSVIDQVLHYEG